MPKRCERVLAIDPTTKGFGFVVLEGPDQLVDWGLKETKREGLEARLVLLERLLVRYSPNRLVVEAFEPGARRSERARELVARTVIMATNRKIRVRVVTRRQVQSCFAAHGAKTKRDIARVIARRLTELAPLMPPPRRAWMSADTRMSVFGAAALLLVMDGYKLRFCSLHPIQACG